MTGISEPTRSGRRRPPVQVVGAVVLVCAVNLVVVLAETIGGFGAARAETLIDGVIRLAVGAAWAYALWHGGRIFRWFFLLLSTVGLVALIVHGTGAADVAQGLAITTALVLLLVAPDTWRSGQPAR
ncbi:hypothetical protein ACIBF5_24345 [Micromonospora sp. NPDC050417]|uniref:hypothetical protein n=1 Tax=Micromonospora sp. NPDC050417 TaxID=3364280 RepID=UPI0037B24A0A